VAVASVERTVPYLTGCAYISEQAEAIGQFAGEVAPRLS
jgi:hypothetical protein